MALRQYAASPYVNRSHPLLPIGVCLGGIVLGLCCGFLVGVNPILPLLLIFMAGAVSFVILGFQQTVLGLLIVRSSLDVFADYQLPALVGMSLILLTIAYIIGLHFARQPIHTDGFWWALVMWVGFQAIWLVLQKFGALGLGPSYLGDGVKEFIRMFSFLMVYLLIMQFKGELAPNKIITYLCFAIVAPVGAAFMQMLLPAHMLPSFLVFDGGGHFEVGSRINGTLGHASTFSTFTILFIAISTWQLGYDKRRKLFWGACLILMAYLLVASKALAGLAIFMIFVISMVIPRLSVGSLIGGVIFLTLVMVIFGSSPYGQERLESLYDTPLLNPDIDWSRSVTLAWFDGNSFNWRVSQWTFLLDAWKDHPWWGNGIGSSSYLSSWGNLPHNDYVKALTEQGIIGLGAHFIFQGMVISRLVSLINQSTNPHQKNLVFAMLAFFLGTGVGMLVENVWSHTTMWFYWWTLMAVAGWDWDQYESKAVERKKIEQLAQ